MRRTICACIAALFFLASFAMSAAAECVWVLWEDTIWPKGKPTTEPVRAYKTKPDCDQGLAEVLASFTGPTVVSKDTKRQEAFVMMGKEVVGYRYVCLPDTSDPRGPKGKQAIVDYGAWEALMMPASDEPAAQAHALRGARQLSL